MIDVSYRDSLDIWHFGEDEELGQLAAPLVRRGAEVAIDQIVSDLRTINNYSFTVDDQGRATLMVDLLESDLTFQVDLQALAQEAFGRLGENQQIKTEFAMSLRAIADEIERR